MLAGVSPSLLSQLQRTGMVAFLGEENIFPATQKIGESGNNALRAAREWLDQTGIQDHKARESV